MDPERIIGKTFITFAFKNQHRLDYDDVYKELEGKPAVVLNLHSSYPEYTNCRIEKENGSSIKLHYPTQEVIEHIEKFEEEERIKNTPVDLNKLMAEILEKTKFVVK